jgi:hypothetical protein
LKKVGAVIIGGNADDFSGKPHNRVLFRLNLLFFLGHQFDAGVDQESAQDIDQKMEFADQTDPGKDENTAENNGAENAPEQNLPLSLPGYGKIGKNSQEDKKVVDTQRILDEISGRKQNRLIPTLGKIQNDIKDKSQADPEGNEFQSFFDGNNMSFTLKDKQIEEKGY